MRTINNFIEKEAIKYVRGSVLDVGGGWGRWKKFLSPHAAEYFISDMFAAGADFKDDARKLSNKSASFDTVVCFEMLEHVDDTRAVVSEIYRVLKNGGYAVVTAPFMYVRHGNPNDYYRFTPQGLEFIFKQVGFEVVKSGSLGNLTTVLGVIWKSKFKNYARNRPRKFFPEKLYFLLHQIFLRLQKNSRANDPDYFTHSFIIVKKI